MTVAELSSTLYVLVARGSCPPATRVSRRTGTVHELYHVHRDTEQFDRGFRRHVLGVSLSVYPLDEVELHSGSRV
jgi:hypothetical protein